jgi:hypothetical protein
VADHNLSLVGQRQGMDLKLSFATTKEGALGQIALERALETGDPVTLEGGSLPTIEYAPWYRRLYGDDGIQPDRIEITAQEPSWSLAVAAEASSPGWAAMIPFIELRPKKGGRKHVTLTNEHQHLPIRIRVDIDAPGRRSQLAFALVREANGVYEAKETLAFMLAARSPGGRVRLINRETGELLVEGAAKEPYTDPELHAMRLQHEFLEKLCFIESRIARYGSLSLKGGVTREDVLAADRLFHIFKNGHVEGTIKLTLNISPDEAAWRDSGNALKVVGRRGRIKLLNIVVPLGDSWAVPSDPKSLDRQIREAREKALATQEPVPLHLHDLRVVLEYPDWTPGRSPWSQLYEVASSQAGYFDIEQARETGHGPEILESMIQAQVIERCTSEVFRLIQFPSSDHEDLVLIWLETDRKGVFSHDTALALLDLSDAMPARRHITVPPGWKEGRRALEANVVVHRALVDASEMTWHGPVPVTKPLRTLQDCIADDVPREIIDQAIAEGARRGLFTRADVQRKAADNDRPISAESA